MALDNLISKAVLQGSGKPRYQAIADEMTQLVMNGQIPIGERLPPQRKLARSLGVTAGTVSHAYAILEQRGLASARVGDGTYVRAPEGAQAPAGGAAGNALVDMAHNIALPTGDAQALADALRSIAADAAVLQQLVAYQSETGHPRHREVGAQWLRRFGTRADASRVMVTHGAQHGLACVLRTLARPGDAVLTENLSYPGLQSLARLMRLQLVGVDMDEQGLLPDALEQSVRAMGARILFCTPSLHNPTNALMSEGRRESIARVARRHNLLVIEDAVYAAALAAPPPALSTWLPEHSFLLSSFSKVMAPGLRVGYIEAAPQWLTKFAASMRSDCWMVAPLMPEIATRWLESGVSESLIAAQRSRIAERLALVHTLLTGLDYRCHPESALVWLPLPEPWQAAELAAAARQAGVLVRTPDHFAVGRATPPNAVRISLNAAANDAQVAQGLSTLASILQGAAPLTMDA